MTRKIFLNILFTMSLMNIMRASEATPYVLNSTPNTWNSALQSKVLADTGVKNLAMVMSTARRQVERKQVFNMNAVKDDNVYCIKAFHSKKTLATQKRRNAKNNVFQGDTRCNSRTEQYRILKDKQNPGYWRIRSLEKGGDMAETSKKVNPKYYNIEIQEYDVENASQLWKIIPYKGKDKKYKGLMHVINKRSNFELDIKGGNKATKRGVQVISYKDQHNGNNQTFYFIKARRNKFNWKKSLFMKSGPPAKKVVDQKQINDVKEITNDYLYCIKAFHSRKTISTELKTSPKNNVFQSDSRCDKPAEFFNILKDRKNSAYWRFRSVEKGGDLGQRKKKTNGNRYEVDVQKYDPNNQAQQWNIINYRGKDKRYKGLLHFINKESKYQFDIAGGNRATRKGTPVIAWKSNHNGNNQTFYIVKAKKQAFNWNKSLHFDPPVIENLRVLKTPQSVKDGSVVCIQSVHSKRYLYSKAKNGKNLGVSQRNKKCGARNHFRVERVHGQANQLRFKHVSGGGYLTTNMKQTNPSHLKILDLNENAKEQIWSLNFQRNKDKAAGMMHLRNVGKGSELDLWAFKMNDGAPIVSWNKVTSNNNQKWVIKFVSQGAPTKRTRVRVQKNQETNIQKITNDGVYCLKALHSRKTVSTQNKGHKSNNVFQSDKTCESEGEHFRLLRQSGNEFRVRSMARGGDLAQDAKRTSNGRRYEVVVQFPKPEDNNQLWKFIKYRGKNKNFKGLVHLINKKSGFQFDIAGGNGAVEKNASVITWKGNHNGNNQTFYIIKVRNQKFKGKKSIFFKQPVVQNLRVLKTPQSVKDGSVVCIQSVHSKRYLYSKAKNGKNLGVSQRNKKCGARNHFRVERVHGQANQLRFKHVSGGGYLTTNMKQTNPSHLKILDLNENAKEQIWSLNFQRNKDKAAGMMHLRNVGKGSELDLWAFKMNDGAPIVSWNKVTSNNNQKWVIKFVSQGAPTKRTRVRVQKKQVVHRKNLKKNGVYCIKSFHSRKSMGFKPEGNNNQLYQTNTKCKNSLNWFRFIRKDSNLFWIRSMARKANLALSKNSISGGKGFNIVAAKPNRQQKRQLWKLIKYQGKNKNFKGLYHFQNVKNTFQLDVFGGSKKNGAKLIAWRNRHNGGNQSMYIVHVKNQKPKVDKVDKKQQKKVRKFCILSLANISSFGRKRCLMSQNLRMSRIAKSKNRFRFTSGKGKKNSMKVLTVTKKGLVKMQKPKKGKSQEFTVLQREDGSFTIMSVSQNKYVSHTFGEKGPQLKLVDKEQIKKGETYLLLPRRAFKPEFKGSNLFCLRTQGKGQQTLVMSPETHASSFQNSKCEGRALVRLTPANTNKQAYFITSPQTNYVLSQGQDGKIVTERNKFLARQMWRVTRNKNGRVVIVNVRSKMRLVRNTDSTVALVKPKSKEFKALKAKSFVLKQVACAKATVA